MKRFIYIALCIFLLGGCGPETEEITILESSEISLTWKGVPQMEFSEEACQLAYNEKRNEYRVYDDKLANWFVVRCSEKPTTEGQELTADLKWTSSNSTKTRNRLTFIVEKTDVEGHIWLWCESDAIGVIVKEL